LFKEYVTRVSELLEQKANLLGEHDELLDDIHRWLRSEPASGISRWKNPSPNNTLLEHRDYRRVWDSWRWLQDLETQLALDYSLVELRQATIDTWESRAKSYSAGKMLFGEMPVLFDYDDFTVSVWSDVLAKSVKPFVRKLKLVESILDPVCVDLTHVKPRWSSEFTKQKQTLNDKFVWQRWGDVSQRVDIALFGCDAAVLRSDVITITCPQTYAPSALFGDECDAATSAFVQRLREHFEGDELTWLVPDVVNDFELATLRRNLNARYSRAVPLPRSVAAVNETVGYPGDLRDGYRVLVVDRFGDCEYATPLTARHDSELESRIPETRGFYWERLPHVVLTAGKLDSVQISVLNHFDIDGKWQNATDVSAPRQPSPKTLEDNPGLGRFDQLIVVASSPVQGGVELQRLQRIAGDIPLWRDHIPELAIRVMDGRRFSPFELVGRETVIRPIRGIPIEIPIRRRFTLPRGRARYQFPLAQGQSEGNFGFVATLESPEFPLGTDVECRLKLTYTYGNDDPYRLMFEPAGGEFKPTSAKWKPRSMVVISDASGPQFPEALPWASLCVFPNRDGSRPSDLLQWAMTGTKRLLELLQALRDGDSPSRAIGTVAADWKVNQKGSRFTFANIQSGESVYVHELAVAREVRDMLGEGAEVFLAVEETERGLAATAAATSEDRLLQLIHENALRQLRTVLRFPCIKIWDSSRSLADLDCPETFRNAMRQNVEQLEGHFLQDSLRKDLKQEIKFLLCCWNAELSSETGQTILNEIRSGTSFDPKTIGFALGDLSQSWQAELLDYLLSNLDSRSLEVLGFAIWRSQHFLGRLNINAIFSILFRLVEVLKRETEVTQLRSDKLFSCTRYCELLLGLLRTRGSLVESLQPVLQPSAAVTVECAKYVDRLTLLVTQHGLVMRSYIQLDNLPDKPLGDNTPDLLFALQLYLAGDLGVDAIRISATDEDV
jgi:cold shock CspA family protein